MRKFTLVVFSALAFISCKQEQKEAAPEIGAVQDDVYASYASVGEDFSAEDILSAEEMAQRFGGLELGDTIAATFKAEVASVCKNKGCWMNLNLKDGQEAAVKFKDYGFFVPKDIEEKEVVVHGKAFVSVVSVDEQRHYAEDGGQSAEEIAAITEPKRTLSFLADGVLIEQ